MTLLTVYWCAMLGMIIYARSSGDLKPGRQRWDWGSIPHISIIGDALVFDRAGESGITANNIVSFRRTAVAA